jgi:hypothetical protein
MKVNIDQTLEVTDEERVQIANVVDGKISKRQATRDEMKQFIWAHGGNWAASLTGEFANLQGAPVNVVHEDLIGPDGSLDDIL